MDFKKWVKSIQTAGYNGARTVPYIFWIIFVISSLSYIIKNLLRFNLGISIKKSQCVLDVSYSPDQFLDREFFATSYGKAVLVRSWTMEGNKMVSTLESICLIWQTLMVGWMDLLKNCMLRNWDLMSTRKSGQKRTSLFMSKC